VERPSPDARPMHRDSNSSKQRSQKLPGSFYAAVSSSLASSRCPSYLRRVRLSRGPPGASHRPTPLNHLIDLEEERTPMDRPLPLPRRHQESPGRTGGRTTASVI